MRNKLSVISLLIVLLFAGIAGSTGCGPQQTTQTPGYPYYPRDHMRGPGGMMDLEVWWDRGAENQVE